MKKHAVVASRGGRKRVFDSKAQAEAMGYVNARKVDRVYLVRTKDGIEERCRLDPSEKWWFPIREGAAPIRSSAVAGLEDVTASLARVL